VRQKIGKEAAKRKKIKLMMEGREVKEREG